MFSTLLRVLFGFIVASLIAGIVQVGFVMTPGQIYALPENQMYDRLGDAGMLALVAATQSAIFAAPFALVAAAVAEWLGIRNLLYYLAVALVICGGGYAALYLGEAPNQPTIVNTYASTTFLIAGLASGLVYWLLAGRSAGDSRDEDDLAALPPMPQPKPSRPAAAAPPPARPVTPAAPPPSPSPPPRKV